MTSVRACSGGVLALIIGCGDPHDDARQGTDSDSGASADDFPATAADASASASASATMADSGDDSGESAGDDTGDPPPPMVTCEPPLGLYDTSSPTAVVGDGTAASCTGAALTAAATQGGTITFDCGSDPVTIAIDTQIALPIDRDTIIDGGGRVTLDAMGVTRHFIFDSPDFMVNDATVVLQRLTFVNGAAPAGEYFPQDPAAPACAYGYKEGSGGAIYVRDGKLHVFDSQFIGNAAALEGPDVGGGAIYVLGSAEVLISGSEFRDNRGANGGAIGLLFANPYIYNSVFENNEAVGVGQNYVEPGCPFFNHDEQGGAGGNAGAIAFDGMNDDGVTYTLCGAVFRGNRANEIGGALLRTPNVSQREMLIDRCVFDGNSAPLGGATFIKQNHVVIAGSTFMGNRAGVDVEGNTVPGGLGGLWINDGWIELENSTFFDNQPSALDIEGMPSTVRNATFVQSTASGVSVTNSIFVDTQCGTGLEGGTTLQWPEGTPCVAGASFADPGLGELGDHGGATPTFVPAADGPAIGAGSECPELDQRGEARDAGACALGSVEP